GNGFRCERIERWDTPLKRECRGFREYPSGFSPIPEKTRAASPDIGIGTESAELTLRNMLLDDVKTELRIRHYSLRTEEAYVGWIRRFIVFNGKRHPREIAEEEIQAFLAHLAVERHVSASTQNQA